MYTILLNIYTIDGRREFFILWVYMNSSFLDRTASAVRHMELSGMRASTDQIEVIAGFKTYMLIGV